MIPLPHINQQCGRGVVGLEEREEAYTGFAGVYDEFMDNVPYAEWCKYLTGLLKEYGVEDGLVLDLGCGTGTLTQMLSEKGFDMIGVDSSLEMLEIAIEKKEKSGKDILYLYQDMRELELYGTVNAVVSICDSINYITEPESLKQVFRLVNNYLEKDGIFIFDLNTVYKYENLLGDSVFAENREECSFIWDNLYDESTRINEYDLTLFLKDKESGYYRKFEELHYQRAYELSEIKELLKQAGMEFLAAYDAFTRQPPREDSERIYVIAREKYQEGKKYIDKVPENGD